MLYNGYEFHDNAKNYRVTATNGVSWNVTIEQTVTVLAVAGGGLDCNCSEGKAIRSKYGPQKRNTPRCEHVDAVILRLMEKVNE